MSAQDSAKENCQHRLKTAGIQFIENASLASITTFRTGGTAWILARPTTSEEMEKLQKILLEERIPFFFLGGGSNILISDRGFDGVVILPNIPEEIIIKNKDSNKLSIYAPGINRAPWFGKQVSKMGYQGLEFLTTIPGQLGGAIIQNAGCYGWEITDVIESVDVIVNGKLKSLSNLDCKFSYRNSIFKKHPEWWIAGGNFQLLSANQEIINDRIKDFKERRLASQPRNRKSAGSIFKNPTDQEGKERKAWEWISAAGLRGIRQGGAEISAEHCNFIINHSQAKSSDVYHLICLIEAEVFNQFGIILEKEVVLVGNFDPPPLPKTF